LTLRPSRFLDIEVTKVDVGDGRMLRRLVDGSASKAGLKGVVADGAYDSKNNFRVLADLGIDPLIRLGVMLRLRVEVVCLVSLLLWSSLAMLIGRRSGVMVIGGWLSQRFQA
jgi:hypothetical protein